MSPENLFEIALTHASYAHEHACEHNERLEFLGDAVLQLLVTEALYQRDQEREGAMTWSRQSLVNKDLLATLARELGLDAKTGLRLGAGALAKGDGHQDKPLSDAWEALLGAVYLALGLDAAREVVAATVLPRLGRPGVRDPKSRLQEWCQQLHKQVPAYQVVGRDGPDNDPEWVVEVSILAQPRGQGRGRNKRDAEKRAAEAALGALGLLG
ncbi:ribonuclease III [Myxococcota bacterium]|nr:ribonuclease III [Myxococcota bacterium]